MTDNELRLIRAEMLIRAAEVTFASLSSFRNDCTAGRASIGIAHSKGMGYLDAAMKELSND